MAFLDWSPSLSVQSTLIDTDHKRLIELINALYDLCEKPHGTAEGEAALGQLINATKAHFTHEETLMRKAAYPAFIPHKIAHDRLLAQIEDFAKRVTANQTHLSPENTVFLRTWLSDHIMKVDKPLGEWLVKNKLLSGGETASA